MKTEKFNVSGMTCAACQANVERCVRKLDGTQDVNVSLLANQMTVSYDENKVKESDIIHAVENIGYGAESAEKKAGDDTTEAGSFKKEWEDRKARTNRSTKAMSASRTGRASSGCFAKKSPWSQNSASRRGSISWVMAYSKKLSQAATCPPARTTSRRRDSISAKGS